MSKDEKNTIWIDKYSPKSIDEVILDPKIRNMLNGFLNKETIPNLLFYGKAGIGKTLIAKLIAKQLNATLMFINASAETGVDVIRNKVIDFANSIAFDNGLKIVICDEFDFMSQAAQASLRDVIQANSDDTRFIFTCNYNNKVMEPLQSRCIPVQISFDIKDVVKRCFDILDKEGINYSENRREIAGLVKKTFPDIRQTLGTLELCCVSDKFELIKTESSTVFGVVADYIIQNLSDVRECRKYWIANENIFESDYIQLAHAIFNKMETPDEFIVVGEYIYRMNVVLDKEIQFTSMITQLYKMRN